MKTTTAFCALSYAISIVGATRPESNAQRLARGLPPLAPKRRFSNLRSGAKRVVPSSTPFSCSPQKNFCCSTIESASSPAAESLLSSLGISQNSCGEQIATGCVAASGDSCSSGTLAKCCGNIVGSELVGIDCTKVTPSTTSSAPASSSSHASSSAASSAPASSSSAAVSSSSAHASSSSSASSSSIPSSSSAVHSSSTSSSSAAHSSSASASPRQQRVVVVFVRKQLRRILFFRLGLAC
ncbi:hypothetical protein MSAN_00198600 [Mycena sanguinolenta]|uniref:Hydrophobin n=1 Tax=Mycena sanguinolenta TaxID=230812 RepID=A0A8H7DNK9_9AGAR|nr:hypothetical protein MSAN_00198600 [Mycena sanguinolenta]